MLTVILPVYGSGRKEGVEGLLPIEEPGLDLGTEGNVRGDCGRYPLAETGRFKSEILVLFDNRGKLRPGGLFDREELERITGTGFWKKRF